jgi:hypothetical protein
MMFSVNHKLRGVHRLQVVARDPRLWPVEIIFKSLVAERCTGSLSLGSLVSAGKECETIK